MEFLDFVFWHNPVRNWIVAAVVATAVYVGLILFRRIVVKRFKIFSRRTQTHADDLIAHVLKRTHSLFIFILALAAAALFLRLPPAIESGLNHALVIAFFIQAGLWATSAITFGKSIYRQERLEEDAGSVTVMSALVFVGRLVLWIIVLLLILDNLGVEITSLVAGLGIGGIAVALAVQNILGDLFASLSIVLDKPFVIGDFIVVGNHKGTVEKIGLKTTRLRSLTGEQLIFSNTDLLQSRINNFKRMEDRRVAFNFGVLYETPIDKVEQIGSMVRELVEAESMARFDRAHFLSFGDSSLDFEVVYYVLTPDYATYADIQQRLNLNLMRRFEAEGIEFAYPTQTLYVKNEYT
jgi:small-conductance mechanosensitive channel